MHRDLLSSPAPLEPRSAAFGNAQAALNPGARDLTVALAFNVSVGRFRRRIPHGEGPNRELARAIRAHMNSVEHLVPIGLLLLSYGLLAGSATAIAALGTCAVLARISLSIGILRKGAFRLRQLGAYVTYAIEAVLCAIVLVAALSRLAT